MTDEQADEMLGHLEDIRSAVSDAAHSIVDAVDGLGSQLTQLERAVKRLER